MRQRALRLTPEGGSVLVAPRVAPTYRQLLAPLTPAEQAEPRHLLRKFVSIDGSHDTVHGAAKPEACPLLP